MAANDRYIYQRRGGPLLSWAGGPPRQSQAAEIRSLGSLGDDDVFGNPRGLPRPGAPEFLDDWSEGSPPVRSSNPPIGVRGVGDAAPGGMFSGTKGTVVVLGLAGLVAWFLFRKKKH